MICVLVAEFQDSCGDISPPNSGTKANDEKFSLIGPQHCDVVQKNPPASQNEGDILLKYSL